MYYNYVNEKKYRIVGVPQIMKAFFVFFTSMAILRNYALTYHISVKLITKGIFFVKFSTHVIFIFCTSSIDILIKFS